MKAGKEHKQQQEKSNTVIQRNEGKSFVKPKGDADSFSPPKTSGRSNKSLPAKLQSNMENSLGQDFSSVGIHTNSQKAVQMKARAFTQSEQIHFAPGQFNPGTTAGQNLIGHEFTHIAQQRAGVVKPTKALQKGVMINDDRSLESEADNFGRKAARGEAVSKYRSASLGMRSSARTAQAKSNVVQMAMQETHFGKFHDDTFNISINAAGQHSVEMDMRFEPKNNVDAELIGMVQSVRSIKNKSPYFINNKNKKIIQDRSIEAADAIVVDSATKETDESTHIDQATYNRNPLYAAEGAPGTDKNLSDTLPVAGDVTKSNTWGRHGYRKMVAKAWKSQDARLHDETGLNAAGKDSGQIFETTALAVKGNQEGTYYGSVEWGWRTDSKGNFTKIPFKTVTMGVPSSTFLKSAEIWNTTKTSKGEDTLNLPTPDVKTVSNILGVDVGLGPVYAKAPFGTRVVVLPTFVNMMQSEIRVVDGPLTGETGTVFNSDLADERN